MTLLQFLRLMALAVIITSLSLGLGLYQLYSFTALETLLPWISWNNVHHNFSDVGQFPLIIIPQDRLPAMWAFWSAQPVSALVFFLLFGPTAQALNDIVTAWRWVKKRIGRLTIRGNNRPKGAQSIMSFTS
jgi:pheromone a factor receptor